MHKYDKKNEKHLYSTWQNKSSGTIVSFRPIQVATQYEHVWHCVSMLQWHSRMYVGQNTTATCCFLTACTLIE